MFGIGEDITTQLRAGIQWFFSPPAPDQAPFFFGIFIVLAVWALMSIAVSFFEDMIDGDEASAAVSSGSESPTASSSPAGRGRGLRRGAPRVGKRESAYGAKASAARVSDARDYARNQKREDRDYARMYRQAQRDNAKYDARR